MNTDPRTLIRQGYQQISRKYRLVARLPEGKTGIEALRDVDPALISRWEENLERRAAEFFCRVYSKDTLELSEVDFKEFRFFMGGGKTI